MARVSEQFLINPPKRRLSRRHKAAPRQSTWRPPSAKALGPEGSRHRPVVYSHKGHWFTSATSKIARPGHKLNPFRRRRKMRRNPFGEEVMLVGLNPRRGGSMALFGRRRRARHNDPDPARRHRRYRHNRARRYYRHNPMTGFTSIMPMVLGGTAGAIAVKWLPRVLGLSSGIMYYGAQIGAIVGDGWVMDKMISKGVSDGWVIGSAAVLVTDLLSGVLSPLGLAGFSAFPPMGPSLQPEAGYAGMGAMPSYHEAFSY